MPEAPDPLHAPQTPAASAAQGLRGWLRQRWRGQVPLRRLFWRDMLVLGTVLNLLCSFAALLLAAMGLPVAWAVALHFAPTPWNAFLVMALWRTPGATTLRRSAALAWFCLMFLV